MIVKGWVVKAKGLLQVLWERGWIDEEQIHKYRLDAVNDNGEQDEEYSLVALMSSCLDFAEEKSELEATAIEMGAKVMTTTKYHAEYAGEGIEYAWGVMKSTYFVYRDWYTFC